MDCQLIATYDGQPCGDDLLAQISRNIALFEFGHRPIDSCRVVLESASHDRAPGRSVCARVAICCSGDRHEGAACCAVRDDEMEAIDAAFDVALMKACRDASQPRGSVSRLQSGHVVELSPGCESIVLETDDGRKIEFALLGKPESVRGLHVGDRAWVMQVDADHQPRELIFQDHGKKLRAWLQPRP